MKKIKITYWVITICTLIGFLLSAVNELLQTPKTLAESTESVGLSSLLSDYSWSG